MHRNRIATAACTLALIASVPLLAAQSEPAAPSQAPGAAEVSRISGGTYQADPQHTLVEWSVDHMGFSPYFGLFGSIDGTLQLDPSNPEAAKVDVTIPVAKVTTASEGLNEHLLKPAEGSGKPDFFGANPQDAKFVSTKVEKTGDDTAQITGDLTLNGFTRPVTLDTHFYGAGTMRGQENVGFEATASIMRSDFGLGFAVPLVSDTVELKIAAAFTKSETNAQK
ncbi:YceI family protein [Novosphingobium aquimarinum]|uniref:YceI family protein n=1 Tax=Novosphingobium aquimarinum TaxID=2682494 RepID=UPI0012EB10E7|nr:YceI family protein [Novosphingobium aquimarinum]